MSDLPPTESPAEDWVEQRESVQPELDDDEAIADELEADEADLAEQARAVPVVDDDYDR